MTRAEEFEELRPLLFGIAYRILGSVAEAVLRRAPCPVFTYKRPHKASSNDS